MNSKHKGNITEIETILSFMKLGYNVLIPYGDCERYDYVVDINGRLIKIQTKTSRSINNGESFSFSCRSSNKKDGKIIHRKYTCEEIDYFATMFNENCYLIPTKECGTDKIIRVLPTKNGQTKRISWAEDYEIEKVTNDIISS